MQLHHSGIGVSDWSSINQYCPIADHGQRHVRMGHWLCDRRHAILLVISQTSSQNVNLTSLCRAHPPSGRFSNIFKQVFHLLRQVLSRESWGTGFPSAASPWKLSNALNHVNFPSYLTWVESGEPWSCVREPDPAASLPSCKSTHTSPSGTWGVFWGKWSENHVRVLPKQNIVNSGLFLDSNRWSLQVIWWMRQF